MRRRAFLRLVSCLIASGFVSDLRLTAHAADKPFTVYMTFDDGPFSNPDFKTGPTDLVLQILKENGARATFFLHGRHITDWDGPVLVRYLAEGHAIGNHLWRQGGNTVADNPTIGLLTQQYLQAEVRIREVLQQSDRAAYQQYLAQPKLFRRPGGNNGLNEFLKQKHFRDYKLDPYLRLYWDKVDWLTTVYDYSGWHINGGESIPASIRPTSPDEQLNFILNGGHAYYGIHQFLKGSKTNTRSDEVDAGLIILMHDADKNTDMMLPKLIQTLRDLGAEFSPLPRSVDKPNTKTVGIGYEPTYPFTPTDNKGQR